MIARTRWQAGRLVHDVLGHRNRRDDTAQRIADRRRDRAHARLGLAAVFGIALATHQDELGERERARSNGPMGPRDEEIAVDIRERYRSRSPTGRRRPVANPSVPATTDSSSTGCCRPRSSGRRWIDLVSSLISGKLKFPLTELSAIPRAAVVVEERYSQVFKLDHARPSVGADGITECQIRFPTVPIVLCETRKLAQAWTYRFLAAARVG